MTLWPSGHGEAQLLPSDEDRLNRGEVIISFKEAPDTRVHEVKGEILFDAPAEMVWEVMTDYKEYARIFPDIHAVEVLPSKDETKRLHVTVKNIWPSPDYNYILAFAEDKPAWTITWKMEEGNLKSLYGSFSIEFFPKDPKKVKAIYVMARNQGWIVPTLNADLANRAIVIDRLLAVRKELRERKKALDEDKPSDIKPQWRKAIFWWEKDQEEPAQNKDDAKEGEATENKEGKPTDSGADKEEKPPSEDEGKDNK